MDLVKPPDRRARSARSAGLVRPRREHETGKRWATRMGGFPIAWEDTPSIDQLSDIVPYSIAEIEDYLFGNHYHLMLGEEPTTFEVSGPHSQKQDTDRRFWLFEARDRAKKRQWFVIVATGRSPFDPSKHIKRWIYANTNDNSLSPDEFLDEEYREQLAADVRAR
jgi:hypothetical protein